MRRAIFELAILAGSLSLSACEKNEALPIFPGAGADDLVIAAIESADGELQTVTSFLVRERPPSFARTAGSKLHFFLAAEGDLRGIDGATFATGLASRLEVVDGARPGGACDRCNGATASAPQLLYDGDRCTLPPFFSYSGDGDPQAIASRLRLTVRGECACERYREDPAGALPVISLYDLDGDVWPHDAVAVTAGGVAGLFGEHHSITVQPDGTRTVADAVSPFDGIGTPLTATGTRDETFWIAALRDDDQNSTVVLDARLNTLTHDLPPEFSAHRVRALDDGRVLALGKINRAARTFLCNSAAPTACREIVPAIELLGVSFTDAAIASDGTIILAGFSGLLFLDGFPTGPVPSTACTFGQIECSGELPGGVRYRAVALPDDVRRLDFVQSVAVAGDDRLLVCTHGLGAELSSVALEPGIATATTALIFEPLASRAEPCGRFSRGDALGAQKMVFGSGTALWIPATGPAVEEPSSKVRGAESNFDHLISWTGETPREVFVDGVRVYGDPALEEARLVELIADRDRVLGLRSDGKIELITEFQKASAQLLLQAGEAITAGAIDRGDGSLVVAVAGADGVGLARASGSALGALSRIDHGALSGGVAVLDSVGPGVFVLGTFEGAVWVLSGSTLARAELDPGCALNGASFTGITAVVGRAWISGTSGVFLEVNAYADPPRARCIALTRETQTHAPAGTKPWITGALGLCADDVLIGASADSNEARNARGSIWELTSAERCTDPDLDRCVVDADDVLAGTKVIAGAPVLAGDRRVVTAAFRGASWHGGTIVRLGVAGQYRFPEQILHAARAPWGDFYYGTLFGRVLRGRL